MYVIGQVQVVKPDTPFLLGDIIFDETILVRIIEDAFYDGVRRENERRGLRCFLCEV
jgi:hypothetical protein